MESKKYIGDILFSLTKELKKITEEKLAFLNMGQGQLNLLLYLFKESRDLPLKQDRIAKEMHLNKANVSRNISKLKEKGLIEAETDPMDIRQNRVKPSPEAYKLKGLISGIFQEINKRMTDSISHEELEMTIETISKMLENLSRENKDDFK